MVIIIVMGGHHKLRNIKKERALVMVIFQKASNHCYSKGNIRVLPLRSSRPSIQPFINSIYIGNILWASHIPNKCPHDIYSLAVKTDIKPRNEQKYRNDFISVVIVIVNTVCNMNRSEGSNWPNLEQVISQRSFPWKIKILNCGTILVLIT